MQNMSKEQRIHILQCGTLKSEVLRLSMFVLSHMAVFIIDSILLGNSVHRHQLLKLSNTNLVPLHAPCACQSQ